MYGLPKSQREELFTADKELADFLPADDHMMVFSKEIYPAFKDDDFAGYYSTKGRWATKIESQILYLLANCVEEVKKNPKKALDFT